MAANWTFDRLIKENLFTNTNINHENKVIEGGRIQLKDVKPKAV
jgi:hypothetical protein